MAKAVYLHKPMLAEPVARQFEQILNARYLEKEGYGLSTDQITEARLQEFLQRIPEFENESFPLLAGRKQGAPVQARIGDERRGQRHPGPKLNDLAITAASVAMASRCTPTVLAVLHHFDDTSV